MTQLTLPDGFAELTPILAWALPRADQRQEKRRASTSAELRAFYMAVMPRLHDILAEVDRFPLGSLPETHRPLYSIALSLAEVAPHVELYGCAVEVPFAFEESRFFADHGNQQTWEGRYPSDLQ